VFEATPPWARWWLLLALVLPHLALAVPVVLPAGEDLDAWRPYLELVGFERVSGQTSSTPRVEFRVEPSGWLVLATDADGAVRIRNVAAPQSARDREDLVSVANSLLNPPQWTEPSWDELAGALPGGGDVFEAPLTVPQEPPPSTPTFDAPSRPPAPPRPQPVAVVPAPVLPVPEPTPITPEPPPLPPSPQPITPSPRPTLPAAPAFPERAPERDYRTGTTTAPVSTVATGRAQLGSWVRAGASYAGRQGVAGGLGLDVSAGLVVDGALRVGAELSGMTPARIPGIEGKRTSSDLDLGVLLNYVQPAIGMMFGVQGGVGWRMFESEGALFAAVVTPWFAPVVGWDIRLGRLPLHIEPYGTVRIDAVPIDVVVGGSSAAPIRRGVVAWRGGVRLVFQPERPVRDESSEVLTGSQSRVPGEKRR